MSAGPVAPVSQAEMVQELMLGLGIERTTIGTEDSGISANVWMLSDNDVVKLAQAALVQITALNSDPNAVPLALQARIVGNAYAVADKVSEVASGTLEGAGFCPFEAGDGRAEVWSSAFASRVRWIKAGGTPQ